MNSMIKILMITGLFTIVAIGSAWAGRIEDRQARQMHLINRGASSGRLTKFETRELMREQRMIARQIRIARADSILTPVEHRRLTCLQDRAGLNIRRLKHNHLVYRPNRFEKGLAPAAAQHRRS